MTLDNGSMSMTSNNDSMSMTLDNDSIWGIMLKKILL
jgi:hypothetical protein